MTITLLRGTKKDLKTRADEYLEEDGYERENREKRSIFQPSVLCRYEGFERTDERSVQQDITYERKKREIHVRNIFAERDLRRIEYTYNHRHQSEETHKRENNRKRSVFQLSENFGELEFTEEIINKQRLFVLLFGGATQALRYTISRIVLDIIIQNVDSQSIRQLCEDDRTILFPTGVGLPTLCGLSQGGLDMVWITALQQSPVTSGITQTMIYEYLVCEGLDFQLKSNKQRIQKNKKNALSQEQWDILYPQSNNNADLQSFDLTLLCFVISNVFSNVRTLDLPAGDVGVGDDVLTLKKQRNKHVHSASPGIDNYTFQTAWEEISDVLLRLHPSPEFSKKIKQLHDCRIDTEKSTNNKYFTEDWVINRNKRPENLENDMIMEALMHDTEENQHDESRYQDSGNKTGALQRSRLLGWNHGNRRILSKKRTNKGKKRKRKHIRKTNWSHWSRKLRRDKKHRKKLLLKDTLITSSTESIDAEDIGIYLHSSSKIKTEIPLVTDSEFKTFLFQQVTGENEKALSLHQDLKQPKQILKGNASWIFSLRRPQNENDELAVLPVFQQRVEFILNRYFSPTPPSKRETMAYEILRLCTLHDYPKTTGQSCIRLAQAALYYEGAGDKVTCFSCGIQIGEWLPEHVPMDRHRELSPTCPFIQCRESGNVPLSLASAESDTALGASGESAAKPNIVQPTIVIGDKPSCASSEGSSDAGYATASIKSQDRLSTASSGISGGKGSQSSDSGFGSQSSSSIGKSSSGNSSATSSSRSGSSVNNTATSNSGSNSVSSGSASVAQSQSSASSGYQSSRLSQPSQPSTGASSLSRDSGYQTGSATRSSSSGNSSSTHGTTSTATADTQSDTRYRITAQNKNRAHYPEYVLKTDRLRTFINWPSYVQQTPDIMVESGFYFAGYEDCVRCFQCGIGLRNWEPPDNPHVEHARWSPKCPFLISVKGQDFINLVLDAVAQLASRQENSQSTAASGNSSSASNAASSTGTNQSDGQAKNDGTDVKSTANQATTQQAHSTSKSADKDAAIGQFMDTEIVKNVLKLGYSKANIQDAVKHIVTENGWEDATQEKIVKFLEDKNASKTKEKKGKLLGGGAANPVPPEITELKNKNREMREMTICKICLEEEVSIVFLPCGHLVACPQCAPALTRCAVCRKPITGTICAHLDV